MDREWDAAKCYDTSAWQLSPEGVVARVRERARRERCSPRFLVCCRVWHGSDRCPRTRISDAGGKQTVADQFRISSATLRPTLLRRPRASCCCAISRIACAPQKDHCLLSVEQFFLSHSSAGENYLDFETLDPVQSSTDRSYRELNCQKMMFHLRRKEMSKSHFVWADMVRISLIVSAALCWCIAPKDFHQFASCFYFAGAVLLFGSLLVVTGQHQQELERAHQISQQEKEQLRKDAQEALERALGETQALHNEAVDAMSRQHQHQCSLLDEKLAEAEKMIVQLKKDKVRLETTLAKDRDEKVK
uniref:Uncharacterized protein n=1 Tax=Plectus sambesii TaxID=2011161 RepID=A0A914UR36_9BILA